LAFISILKEPLFRYRLALLSLSCIIIGLFLSRAMMSIGMIVVGIQFFLKPDIKVTFKDFIKDKKLLYISLIFFLYLISGLYSSDKNYYIERITLKLPFLFMPLGFAALKEMPKRYFLHVLLVFILLVFFVSLGSTVNFILNYTAIIENYKSAKVIPVLFEINHIRYSLMMALAIFSAFYLFYNRYFIFNVKTERTLFLIMGIFIFLFLHLLSVRSGLLAFYLSLFVMIVSYIITKKKYRNGIVLLALLIVTPLLMYVALPTIRNKVDYMILDISKFMSEETKTKQRNVNNYSDTNRLVSITLGIELGNKSPFIGLGVGDVKNEIFKAYETDYPKVRQERRLIPHNQFVFVYMAVGGIGLLLFCFFSFYPFFSSKDSYSGFLFLVHNTIFISSYMSEATLENQLGVCLFITFYLITYFIDRETNVSQNALKSVVANS
jgi:O-antigen ligase